MRVEARPVRTFPVSQSSVGDCRMTNTRPVMSTGIWPAAVWSSLGAPTRISPTANHIPVSSPDELGDDTGRDVGSWKPHAEIQRQPCPHVAVRPYTPRSFNVSPKRLRVCDFFVELSKSRPTIDPRGRFVIPRLTLILRRSAAVGPAHSATPLALGSRQFRRKPRPGLGGL